MKFRKIKEEFFQRNAKIVAKDLIGKILVRKIGKKELRSRIVETEAYFGESDPASWARFGKRRDNIIMWDSPGKILIKNVHKYKMLNFITGKKGIPEAVLIRALEPLNFSGRLNGPGLLTNKLNISKEFHRLSLKDSSMLWLEYDNSFDDFKIIKSKRVGVKKDLPEKLRFYVKDNRHVSRK
ncbi:MAG TPA: DNA-3-methyladenine glycosylase [Candidatus Nanoarchaeia archaeon]|nr:DNA-3-methyladenine glycosylase [Candidatus Nanoarchaeia archaeon]